MILKITCAAVARSVSRTVRHQLALNFEYGKQCGRSLMMRTFGFEMEAGEAQNPLFCSPTRRQRMQAALGRMLAQAHRRNDSLWWVDDGGLCLGGVDQRFIGVLSRHYSERLKNTNKGDARLSLPWLSHACVLR